MSRFEDNSINDAACSSLRPIKSKVELSAPLNIGIIFMEKQF